MAADDVELTEDELRRIDEVLPVAPPPATATAT